ncbi:type II secretion system F family protein [Aneurinibacillus terranovensis]|uniref:type II secretion system F family protein n=1 Tax=Aneurinibacillus terranovensis TaxID=278991 RepID=UPI00041564A4|nr:type II secretion system F family protein [Aneurinibacillus terranovensis]
MEVGVYTFLSVQLFALWIAFRKTESLEHLYQRIIGIELEKEDVKGKKGKVRLLVRIFINIFPFSPKKDYLKYWERKLMQAGYMNGWNNGLEFFVFRLFHMFIGWIAAYYTGGRIQDYLVLGFLGFYFPASVVQARILQRRGKARPAFRKMLKLMEVQLEKGADLTTSIQNAGEAVEQPLSDIFQEATKRLHSSSVREVFSWVADQFDFPELRKFCVLVIVAEERGTSFLSVVREMIRSMDEKLENDIEAEIGKAKLKIMYGIIFFTVLPFAFGTIIVLGTMLIKMFQ